MNDAPGTPDTIIVCGNCLRQVDHPGPICPHCGARGRLNSSACAAPASDPPREVDWTSGADDLPPSTREGHTARVQRASEFAGIGCAIQGLGLLTILIGIWSPILWLVGILLLLVGSAKSIHYVCGHCRNRLDSKRVTICPACHTHLQ